MGLDIYLYEAAQAEANERYEKASEDLYADGPDGKSKRDAMTDEELAAWGAEYQYESYTDVRSEKHPDHLFNRRYLRSSYNESGFDRAVPNYLGTERGLGWIFAPVRLDDQYDIELTAASISGLREAHARALRVASELQQSDQLRVKTVAPNVFSPPPLHSDDEALEMYRAAVAKGRIGADSWWSNVDMDVFGAGLTVLAAIPGRATLGVPGVHLIYSAADALLSYVHSAEIVAEFCDEAISLIERDGSCSIHWSG